jgi:hypothetical protein
MATTTTKKPRPTTTDAVPSDQFSPLDWLNRARRADGLPPVTEDERQLIRRRQQVYEKCDFNRRIQRLLALLTRAHRELEEFADLDEQAVITEAWAKAKLPPLTEDNDLDAEAAKLLDAAYRVSSDAHGFAWALEQFVSMLDSNVVG